MMFCLMLQNTAHLYVPYTSLQGMNVGSKYGVLYETNETKIVAQSLWYHWYTIMVQQEVLLSHNTVQR